MTRTYDSAKKHQLTTAVALLAAILVGQNVEELTEAAIATTVAANAQLQINFTRAHEKEADYLGIQTLANANFDPHGMPRFFERMQKASRLYGNALPEFLSTHPVTVNRIAESRDRASNMKAKKVKPNKLYAYIKARIEVSNEKDINKYIREHQHSAKDSVQQYKLAIAYLKADKAEQAMNMISPLVKSEPENILYRIAQAEIQQHQGNHKIASENFQQLLQLYPYSYPITIHYARHLLQIQDYKTAYQVLQDYQQSRQSDILSLDLIAKAASHIGKTAEAYLYLAEHDYLKGNTHSAITHLTTASKIKGLDYYLSSQIEAKLKLYKEIALLEK